MTMSVSHWVNAGLTEGAEMNVQDRFAGLKVEIDVIRMIPTRQTLRTLLQSVMNPNIWRGCTDSSHHHRTEGLQVRNIGKYSQGP